MEFLFEGDNAIELRLDSLYSFLVPLFLLTLSFIGVCISLSSLSNLYLSNEALNLAMVLFEWFNVALNVSNSNAGLLGSDTGGISGCDSFNKLLISKESISESKLSLWITASLSSERSIVSIWLVFDLSTPDNFICN